MKLNITHITCLLFLAFAIQGTAQSTPTTELTEAYANSTSQSYEASLVSSNAADEAFEAAANDHNVPQRKLTNLTHVKNGYYIIAGVFSKNRNAKRALKKFKRKGFEAGSIKNPETNLNYLYLQYHTNWQEALKECSNQLNGRHTDDVWILHASQEKEEALPTKTIEDVTYETLEDQTSRPISVAQDKSRSNKGNRALQKADYYFDKMWYDEAADLYELALEDEANHTFEVLQKAADSHYFNTNMEKAHHWYSLLYEKYSAQMSADNIFKYAHALKGTGKYARSKRLMRLYDRKLKDPRASNSALDEERALPKEAILDELRSSQRNFDIFNLAINSKYSEFSPMFHENNEVVFASSNDTAIFNTRKYKWNNQPYLDLYVAKINEETQELKNAIKFSKKINTKYHEASVTFSPDNKTMYFTRNNYGKKLKRDKKGVNHLKIYRSTKIGDDWSEATEVSFNSDNYSTGHPALSPDGKKLYFVSDMPGSIGQTDIFVVDVLEDGSFSEPTNLGPKINTERKEMFPFINNEKLYFSSNGHVGLGGLDIYEVPYTEEDGFLEVKNLGQPVNSRRDDFSYIVNEETQKGFFASNRKGGKGDDDIYSFKRLIVEEVPENLNAIAGVVTEMVTGELMPNTLITLLDENNIKLKEMVAGDDGSFLFEDLEGNTTYTIKSTNSDYFDEEISVGTRDNEVVTTDIAMRRLKEMITVENGIRKLKTDMIHFDFDKYYIRNDASKELDELVQVMTEYPKMVIKIESHTDSRGPRVYNKYLSERRAKSTRDYIISQGIDPSRIQSAIGYGEEKLLNGCDGSVRCSEQNHLMNRRSEFIIVEM